MEPRIVPTGRLGSLSGAPPLIVLAFLDSPELGHRYLQQLSQGNPAPLTELKITDVPEHFDPRVREWGLGFSQQAGKYLLVAGSGQDVNWTLLQDCQPISHSHPLDRSFVTNTKDGDLVGDGLGSDVAFGKGIRLAALIGEMFTIKFTNVAVIAPMVALLPSNQDVRANYLTNPRDPEVLYTPYRWNVDRQILTIDEGHPAIVIDFGPTLAALANPLPMNRSDHAQVYRSFACPLVIRTSDVTIWKGWLTCGWQDAQSSLKTEPPANARPKEQNDSTLK